MENLEIKSQLESDPVKLKAQNIFWLGFIIYTTAFSVSTSGQANYIVCNLFQILGLMMVLPSALFIVQFKLESKYLRVIFILYIVWLIGVILRGFTLDFEYIKNTFFNAFDGTLIYISPLVLLFPNKISYLKKTHNVIIILGIVYVLLSAIFVRSLVTSYNIQSSQGIVEYLSKTLSLPCGLILLTYIYHSNKTNLFALSVLVLSFLLAVVRARRALALLAICPIVASYIISLFHSKNRTLKIVFFFVLAVIISIGIAYSRSIISFANTSNITYWFMDRINEDTRSEVEAYFYQDLKLQDWIFGKGLNGQYYCPGVVETLGSVTIFRTGIETDYLNIILKGGIISLGLMLLITVPAVIMGLFNSKNILSKASAIWILFYLIDLYPAPVTTFTLNYLMVWISVGICYSRKMRNIPDEFIRECFHWKEKKELSA